MNHRLFSIGLLSMALLTSHPGALADEPADKPATQQRQYTYSWLFAEQDEMRPRGGTTRGAPVQLATQPSQQWQQLQDAPADGFEKDRQAILAMAGQYRASFDFIETVGYQVDYPIKRPYQTWGTELVKVIEDKPRFISLQHILVMQFVDEEGKTSEPMVMKHWRQDWRYEDRDLHVFIGDRSWAQQRLSRREAKGAWTQAVFQVDDSPRYEAQGRWEHRANYSQWRSVLTQRPLPRREFSVRDDYQLMEAFNRITITPGGWVMEEDNLKVVIDPEVKESYRAERFLAREAGLTRYELIEGDFFSAGDEYWRQTGGYWQQVRETWADIYRNNSLFRLKGKVDSAPMFAVMFGDADRYAKATAEQRAEIEQQVAQSLKRFLRD